MIFNTAKCCYSNIRALMCFPHLRKEVIEVRNVRCLMDFMGWTLRPELDKPETYQCGSLEDINQRRLRDAEVIGVVCANTKPSIILEIGTAQGITTALMARNAPDATVYTVNILPEDIRGGGDLVTHAFRREEIGSYYRHLAIKNIKQIYANTKSWRPEFCPIDIAFIDGCHDAAFVFSDTCMILEKCRSGSVVLWHDFNPEIITRNNWMAQVCRGVERLFVRGKLRGPILHVQDSFVGLYIVP